MKNVKKLLALILALVMCVSMLAGCNNNAGTESDPGTEPSDGQTTSTNDTLIYGTDAMDGKFSPFFYTGVTDEDVVKMVHVALFGGDREGALVRKGIEGETRSYNGTDYTYTGIADMDVVENTDGTVDYNITLKQGVKFSDGEEMTIDDVIFNLYVMCDPTYDGAQTFSSLPIEGMSDYLSNMYPLYELLVDAGEDNTDFTNWTEEQQKAFWSEGLPAAGAAFAQSIVDYVMSNYCVDGYTQALFGLNAEDVQANEGLQVAFGLMMWGFGDPETKDTDVQAVDEDGNPVVDEDGNPVYEQELTGRVLDALGNAYDVANGEYPTTANYWDVMVACYENDYNELSDTEAASGSLWSYLHTDYQVGTTIGESAPSITGIQKTGDYSMTVHMTEADATAELQFSIFVAPLHYYGDESLYDYDNNQFGFPKGDLSGVKSVTSDPMGAGPYTFSSYENGTVTLQANPGYWEGEPKIKYLKYQVVSDADKLTGVSAGTLDVASPSLSTDTVKELTDINGTDDFNGDVVTLVTTQYLGYGYIGINANNVSVGGDGSSDASKNLRKAIATVLSVYRDVVIDSYYGELAEVINYPISNTSWAAPKVTDEGYKVAFSVDVNGDPIYTDGMSDEEKYAAALEAALGFFEAAGYTVEDGKLTAAPEGAKLEYEIIVPGGGTGDHPNFQIINMAYEALKTIGFNLAIKDVSDGTVTIGNKLEAGTAELWTMAWSASADPDMTQIYFADVANGGKNAGGSNHYYAIADAELDTLIKDARKSLDENYRKILYKEALEIVVDWACEIPVYQRTDGIIFSTERVNVNTIVPDQTPFYGWWDGIVTMEMN